MENGIWNGLLGLNIAALVCEKRSLGIDYFREKKRQRWGFLALQFLLNTEYLHRFLIFFCMSQNFLYLTTVVKSMTKKKLQLKLLVIYSHPKHEEDM